MEKLENQMKDKTDKKTVEDMIKEGLEKYTKTMEEKEEKENNLIIYNIPEGDNEEPEGRKEEDTAFIQALIQDNLEVKDIGEPKAIIRLDRKTEGSESCVKVGKR